MSTLRAGVKELSLFSRPSPVREVIEIAESKHFSTLKNIKLKLQEGCILAPKALFLGINKVPFPVFLSQNLSHIQEFHS